MFSFSHLSPLQQAILAGVVSAFWSMAAPFIPLFGIFLAPLFLVPLFLVSFSHPTEFRFLAFIASSLTILVFQGVMPAFILVLFYFTPSLYLSSLFLKKSSSGTFSYRYGDILSKMILGVLCAEILGLVILNSLNIDWQASFHHHLQKLSFLTVENKIFLDHFIPWIPGLLGISLLMTLVANACLAQKILLSFQQSLRLPQGIQDWSSPLYWDIIFISSLMIEIAGSVWNLSYANVVGKTILSLSSLPLLFIGLRICYLKLSSFSSGRILFRLLVILSFLLVWPLLFVVLLGLIEPWYGLMKRFPSSNH